MSLRLSALALVSFLVAASPTANATTAAPAAEPPGREPVVFVHGLFGSPDNFDTMSLRLRLAGYSRADLVSFGYDSTGSLTTAADAFAAQVREVLADTGAGKVDVVTHSLGGLPSRWYLAVLGGTPYVDDWISLGGPNVGGAPGTCPAPGSVACEQATQGSAFITRLNSADPTPGDVTYTTFASPCDTVVDDAWTRLPGATNVTVGCVSHLNLISDRSVFTQVLQTLTA